MFIYACNARGESTGNRKRANAKDLTENFRCHVCLKCIPGLQVLKAEKQWEDAVEQINRYAVAPRVEALRQGTQLHKIIMQFKGWELARMDEV